MAGGEFKFSDLINAVIAQESRGDPSAVSQTGAVGLMQIRPEHAHDLYGDSAPSIFDVAQQAGFDVGGRAVDDARRLLFDPEINVALGEPYLRDLMRAFDGNVDLALTAYNAGPIEMRGLLADGGEIFDLPLEEQREYAMKVRQMFEAATGRALPETIDTMQLTRPVPRPSGLLGAQ